jgi:tRNA wybutosine-synthesizing protein 1
MFYKNALTTDNFLYRVLFFIFITSHQHISHLGLKKISKKKNFQKNFQKKKKKHTHTHTKMGQTLSSDPIAETQQSQEQNKQTEKTAEQTAVDAEKDQNDDFENQFKGDFVQVLYGSKTKNGMALAYKLAQRYSIKHSPLPVTVTPIDQFEPEDLSKLKYLIIVISTHDDGSAPPSAKSFQHWLSDAAQDFRYGKGWLTKLRFAIVGLGNSDYKRNYNAVAKEFKVNMKAFGAKMFASPCLLDYSDSIDQNPETAFEKWCLTTLLPAVQKDVKAEEELLKKKEKAAALKEKNANNDEQDIQEDDEYYSDEDDDDDEEEEDLVDVEDMGGELDANNNSTEPKKPRKMLSDKQYRTLTKQGYRIVGSHSGVKLCRWLKASTRGRGQCYKHTFYGIISHRCMEMTPSLACASRCTFCWRHNSHPTGKEWAWEMDDPESIIKGALDNQKNMVKQLKGSPGIIPERLIEAQTPKHCALSLVGEPIMYPRINEFLTLLHKEDISSFLVTNAQFPEQIANLVPVTQLYLSIDAHDKDSLKKIDRPLLEDFYERFIACQESLKTYKQRTVYRLTLVKGFNMEEALRGYARCVQIGQPTFIEIKGVTFSGPDGGIRMSNVPYHHEVKQFCEELCVELNKLYADQNLTTQYELACEHAHSCCILIADTRMKKSGKWHTWIDYPKFQELNRKFVEDGTTFTDEDYSCETPDWAVYNATEAGFDPKETRYTARGKNRTNLKLRLEQEALAAAEAEAQLGGCCSNGGEEEQGGCCQTGDKKSEKKQGCCQTGGEQEEGACCKGEQVKSEGGCCKDKEEEKKEEEKEEKKETCTDCDCGKAE